MAKTVKMADIAKKVGVSVVTVSKALTGQKGVSESTRQQILRLADEMGYVQPSAAIRSETKGHNIGIIIHDKYFSKYNSFYLQMYQMLTSRLGAQGDFTILELITHDMEKELTAPNLLKENKIDALVMQGEFSRQYCEFIKSVAGDIPLVYLDFCDESRDEVSVISDSFYGSYYMTNYLFDKGHRDIAFVGSLLQTTSITDRYLGYVKSMMEHGIQVRPDWQIEDRDKNTGIIFEPDKLPLPLELPTAFVCNCDLTAGVLIKRLEKEGYKVPDDFSVVGYDNFIFPGVCDVEITTYEVDMPVMVQKAVSYLTSLLKGEEVKMGTHIITGHLIEKDSVKALS
ncbi:LacI family DNA-binding transcriptional regulator [Butyrivibrio sp. NC2007]|uniref:LacI family DNA-binding transcriptional regulator n=1 Tax=Butyrivibrio sp. NC2007 TaxID=1280683 RepID=UPI0003B4172E|nr:LacI family DNA-binding transcriptional regulator [Butyrivibrio sp. NC2007]